MQALHQPRAAALAAAAVVGLTLGLASGAAHAQETVLRMGHVLAPTHQFHQGMLLAAEKVEAATDGRVKLEVFPSSQLGTERDMHIAIRTGGVGGELRQKFVAPPQENVGRFTVIEPGAGVALDPGEDRIGAGQLGGRELLPECGIVEGQVIIDGEHVLDVGQLAAEHLSDHDNPVTRE